MILGIIFIFISITIITLAAINFMKDMDALFLGVSCGALLATGIFCILIFSSLEPNVEQLCEENSISYGLVQTIAEYTDKSEREIAEFFIIVYDDVEAYEAIQMLDSSLTEKQINAILEIGAMKQAE